MLHLSRGSIKGFLSHSKSNAACNASSVARAAMARNNQLRRRKDHVILNSQFTAQMPSKSNNIRQFHQPNHLPSPVSQSKSCISRRPFITTKRQRHTITQSQSRESAAEAVAAGQKREEELENTVDKLRKQLQGSNVLINMEAMCQLIALSQFDVLTLRLITAVATGCNIASALIQKPRALVPAAWGIVMLIINGVMIVLLLLEKRPVQFSDDELDLYERYFRSKGLTPRHFWHLLRLGKWETKQVGTKLTKQDEPVEYVYALRSGRFQVEVESEVVATLGSGMVGEMSFLTAQEQTATATVTCIEKSKLYVWKVEALREFCESEYGANLERAFSAMVVERIKSSQKDIHVAKYRSVLELVLEDETITPAEKRAIRQYREQHHITDQQHSEALQSFGWTTEEFEDGAQHSITKNQSSKFQDAVARQESKVGKEIQGP